MKMTTLNKGEVFIIEDYQKQVTSKDSFYMREKKNSFRLKPLTVAVSIALAGIGYSFQVAADDIDHSILYPWDVDGTFELNYQSQIINDTSSGAQVTILASGILKFNDDAYGDKVLYVKNTSPSGNSNTVIENYGQILGQTSHTSTLICSYSNSDINSNAYSTNNNSIILRSGSTTKNITLYAARLKKNTTNATATGNIVLIEPGSTLENVKIYGAFVASDANTTTITASNNKVIIGSGVFVDDATTHSIIAAYTSGYGNNEAIGNEVYLYGNANVESANIYGVYYYKVSDSATTYFKDNSLVFGYNDSPWEPENYTVGSVNNFSSIRMDTVNWGKTISITRLTNASTDSTVTKINAENVSFSGVEKLSPGDSYDMLTVSIVESGSIGLSSDTSYYTLGSTLGGTASVELNGNTVTYTVNSIETQPQTHTSAMEMSAGTVALTQGGDTLSTAGFNLANSGISGVQEFSSVGGGMARVNTGSHVNVNTLNFSVGVGNNIQNDYGQLSVGAAFEAGFGKFKNHFNAGKADPYIKKNGDIKYYGIAVLSNMAFENLWHVNGALRYGRIETSQNRALYNFNTNQAYDVDLSSYYIGAELGGGKVIKLDDLNSLDLYGKYFFLHQDGNTFNAGGKYELSSVNSHRLRLAGRYSHNYTPTTALYTGLGAEYEFDGKSELKVDGFWAKPSKTDGIRGFGELGVTITPASNKGLIFDFGIKGLLGDGFRSAWANAEMKYLF